MNGDEMAFRDPLWRHVLGEVLRRVRLAQGRTLKDVADIARISMPYLSEIERGRKEPSSEVLAAAARSLGLNLSQVLLLAQEELSRTTPMRARSSLSVAAQQGDLRADIRRQELCLAA
ncbi:MAG TPA: helix-turn-helix transcriptional regulator [Actinocrinis sp.]|nr:helix-turn-helix transcriptional regulator [Actinocrinis sp.]